MFVLLLVFPLFVFEVELFAPLLLLVFVLLLVLLVLLLPLSSVGLVPLFPPVFPVPLPLPLPLPPLTGKENASVKGA